ncbi:hypothetical protein WBP06_14415 [Novosphingobium sp. BL-8H]|uniref:hypothetical protein n=1 Tax=Novosphingobium sp. BL-8H TaxID=3127640 RepID=UPI0037576322
MRNLTARERAATGGADWRKGYVPGAWALVLVLLACVPLIVPQVPPLTDLPAHMSRFMIQQDAGRSADIARWYHFRWNLIPNLGTDLLAFVLEPLLGLTLTMKAIAILIVALQTAGYLLLSRAAHGRIAASALFALPLAYGYPFNYGFINFTLATALATLSLALWISPWMVARPRLRWLLFCPIAGVVWISHLAGWAVLCIVVGCCELVARIEDGDRFWRAAVTGFVASSCLLVPQALSLLWPHTPDHLPTHGWFLLPQKMFFIANVLADRWAQFDSLSALMLVILTVLAWRSPAVAVHKGLTLAAAVLLGVFWIMPGWVYGSYYADMRMVPTIFALALIALRPVAGSRALGWLVVLGLAFFGARLAGTTMSMALWDRQIRQETAVLDQLPRGSQLVTFNAMPCRPYLLQGRLRNVHIASYALMRRHAFANDQFAMSGGQLLSITNPAAAPFDRDPTMIEIGEPCAGLVQVFGKAPANAPVPLLQSVEQVPGTVPFLWIIWQDTRALPVPGWVPFARAGDHGQSMLYRRAP